MNAKRIGWAGVVLGAIAWYITLPPVLVRTPVPSILLALVAVAAGVATTRAGEQRLGRGAVLAGAIGAIGAVVATKSGVANLEKVFVWSALLAATLRFATPLLLGALGGILSERSGVINVGLEGMMLMGAFFGIFGADVFGSWFLGMLAGMAAGGVLALIHAVFSIALRADQVVSGVAVNFLAAGITGYVFIAHYGDQGTPGEVPSVPEIKLPLVKDIAFVGDAIGEMSLLTWMALLLVPLMALYLYRTPAGLRLR
ncbi:MAG: ral nucleoside transport system permease protein, partial [Thermoleophilaceae bacterium]|nr:ral nucleoside transport system permease protein [Thermoleophilaceae bacterium]